MMSTTESPLTSPSTQLLGPAATGAALCTNSNVVTAFRRTNPLTQTAIFNACSIHHPPRQRRRHKVQNLFVANKPEPIVASQGGRIKVAVGVPCSKGLEVLQEGVGIFSAGTFSVNSAHSDSSRPAAIHWHSTGRNSAGTPTAIFCATQTRSSATMC